MAIKRSVVCYARAAHAFSAGIKRRHFIHSDIDVVHRVSHDPRRNGAISCCLFLIYKDPHILARVPEGKSMENATSWHQVPLETSPCMLVQCTRVSYSADI